MIKVFKFVLDRLFVFVLILSIALFGLEHSVSVHEGVLSAVEMIDFTILGGYYGLFGYELSHAKNKWKYVKTHWVLCVLLALPFVPFARLMRVQSLRKVIGFFGDTAWHVLDELELL